jgi:PRC-barrel domain
MNMIYEDRDPFGIYKRSSVDGPGPNVRRGPGPELTGADTLIGNDVVNAKEENLGDVKEIMLDMRSGKVGYAVLS